MAEVLNERTTRVALKGKKFEVRNPASDQDVVTTEDSVIAKVDKTIVKGKSSKGSQFMQRISHILC